MIASIKKAGKRKKRIALVSMIILLGVLTFYFLKPTGVSYSLPEITQAQNPARKINNYLGKEFEWFLYTPDHVPIYVKETGEGETIVTLHGGFGMSHDYMRQFMKPFEDKFHIVYYDQRGSLRSPVQNNDFKKYITLENMVNDLELLRRALNINKLKLVAHSMGALLAYEYMKKFPEKVGDVVIISGFVPKFPETNAGFHDLFTSQAERAAFSNRKEVSQELEQLKKNMDTTSSEFLYLNWKINAAALQIYDIKRWRQTPGGPGFFNPKLNELIGPESDIPWSYGLKFYAKQKQFDKGTLNVTNQNKFRTPINYIPIIENHSGRIDYMLGTHEVGDWNLRQYKRSIKESDRIKMHIFNEAGHNIWIDKPEDFHHKLTQLLQ